MAKDNCKTRWETFKFWDLVRLILEVLRYYCNGRGGRDDHDDEHDDLLLTKLRVVFYLEYQAYHWAVASILNDTDKEFINWLYNQNLVFYTPQSQKQELENSTVASTRRSLALVYESEQMGACTAEVNSTTRYDTVQYNTILYIILQWLWNNIDESSNSQKTP